MSDKTISKVLCCLFVIHIICIEGREPVIFLALENNAGIILLDLNNGDITVIVDALSNPAIDYHYRIGLLYFTDRATRTISRIQYPSNDDSATPEIIIQAVDNHRPVDVAVDSINNYLYWADDFADSISRADLCGLNQLVILQDSNINEIRGISLDAKNSVIYFTDKGAGKIEKIGLDGFNRQTLYSSADSPNLIYLDFNEQKLYWTNEGSQNIQSMTSGGKDITTVVSYSHYPYGLDGYNGYIYWSQTKNGIIKRSDKSGGSRKSWLYTRPYGVLGVKVYNGENVLPAENNCTTEGETAVSTTETLQTTQEDDPNRCPAGLSSETGYYPGCNSFFPNETFPVEVVSDLKKDQIFPIPGYDPSPSLIPVFRCKFNDVSDSSYFYDVHWYINGDNISSYENKPFEDINSTILRDTEWTNLYKMNMQVKCAVRARYSLGSTPGLYIYSQEFQAGIFPEKYEYSVFEGESIDITLKSTMPVGCITSHQDIRKHCDQSFYIFQPKYDQTSVSCFNNIAKKDVVFEAQFCGIRVGSLDWKEDKTLRVYGFTDGMYNYRDRSTYIRISTSAVSELNDIWKEIQVQDIKVTVIDKDFLLRNRQCRSYNDPHITTFDGRLYHYMNVGEFVMYKNDKGPYSVHALFTNCGFGWSGSSCHCGIAVRSRNSLFVLRTCQTISRTGKHLLQEPVTKLIKCGENDLVIDRDRNNYKITLPIGTEITFTISWRNKFISMIAIKPSISDINYARGLCGIPSTTKDTSDDFTHRQNGPIDDDQDFADSWRITSFMTDEQLFVSEDAFLSYIVPDSSSKRFCTCERQASSTDRLDAFNDVQCNLTETTEFCSGSFGMEEDIVTSLYKSCSFLERRKRYVTSINGVRSVISDIDNVIGEPLLTYDDSVFNTDVTIPITFRNGWTDETALQTCTESIKHAIPSEVIEFVEVSQTEFVESCVMDIKLVGDTTFLSDTIGAMLTYVKTELLRNESLYILNTTDGSQAIIEYFTSFLCLNNCNGNGNCTLGICVCNEKYVGEDCSQSITIPPSNISLPFDGLCKLGTSDCKRTNIFGIFAATVVWYKVNHFQILTDSINYISNGSIFKAEYRDMFMVSVGLTISRRKRATSGTIMAEGYEIRLSNDGTHYGETVSLIVYNETCYSCDSTSLACFEMDFCNPSVVPKGQDGRVSRSCSTTIGIRRVTHDDKKLNAVVAIPIGVLLILIIVIIIVLCYKV